MPDLASHIRGTQPHQPLPRSNGMTERFLTDSLGDADEDHFPQTLPVDSDGARGTVDLFQRKYQFLLDTDPRSEADQAEGRFLHVHKQRPDTPYIAEYWSRRDGGEGTIVTPCTDTALHALLDPQASPQKIMSDVRALFRQRSMEVVRVPS